MQTNTKLFSNLLNILMDYHLLGRKTSNVHEYDNFISGQSFQGHHEFVIYNRSALYNIHKKNQIFFIKVSGTNNDCGRTIASGIWSKFYYSNTTPDDQMRTLVALQSLFQNL